MDRNKRSRRIILSVALACCLSFASGLPTTAQEQERHWEGHGHGGHGGGHGSYGGFSGFSSLSGMVPSVVADVLLVPSLTKSQQSKVRALYMEHRAKSADRMEVLRKMQASSSRRHDDDDEQHLPDGPRSRESGKSGKAERNHSADSKRPGEPGGSKARNPQRDAENSMNSASANLRRTVFSSMMKENTKFQQSIIAVLTEKQHGELKEIARKARSPDYFAINHYDIMNAD